MRKPSKRPQSLSRQGFSLLEIVVTISILAILIAIVIPAIQQARAVARRTECANRLKQIGVAIQSYESTHRHLPFGDKNGFSVLVQILPQLEQGSLYEQLDVEQFPYLTNSEEILRMNRPDFYLCPADVSPRGLRKAGTSYVNSFGTGYFGQPDSASLLSVVADNGPFSRTLGESFTTARIRDGLSHTAFFSEVAGYPPSQVGAVTRIPTRPATVQDWQQLVSDCLAESVAVVSNSGHADEWYTPGLGTSGYIHVAPPNGPSCNFDGAVQLSLYSASSVHGDGVNLLLGDGRVSFISNTVDLPLWRSLGTRDGRESVSWNP